MSEDQLSSRGESEHKDRKGDLRVLRASPSWSEDLFPPSPSFRILKLPRNQERRLSAWRFLLMVLFWSG